MPEFATISLRERGAALRPLGGEGTGSGGRRGRVRWAPATALEIHPHEYVALKNYIAELFDGPIDVLSREGLKPYVRPATTDAIYAF